MKKLIWVTRNFPPLLGGMERLVYNAYNVTREEFHAYLVGPAGCAKYVEDSNSVRESRIKPVFFFLVMSFVRGLSLLAGIGKPALILGGSGLVAPVVVGLAKLVGSKSVILVHGLDLIVQSRLYHYFFLPFLRRADLIIANSENTLRLALQEGVPESKITVVNPGVDFPELILDKKQARQRLNTDSENILLSVGRLIPRKGLPDFIRKSLPGIIRNHPDTLFFIAGSEPQDALRKNSISVEQEIKSALKETGLHQHVRLLGAVDEITLQYLLCSADVFIFPLVEVKGDVEGFGMVAVEAAAYGVPTVAFDCGGVSDAVQDGRSGRLVTPGDYASFTNRVLEVLTNKDQITAAMCREYAQRFNWAAYGKKLLVSMLKISPN